MGASCALQSCSLASCGRSRVSGPAKAGPAGARNHKLGRLQSRLQLLAATSEPAPSAYSFVTEEEQRTMSRPQLEFIERKRRAAAGLGPIMPEQCACTRCAGTGTAVCHQCEGRGTNSGDVGARLSQSERGTIQQTNGLTDMRFFFTHDAPCWLCRGGTTIGCPDCGGSGKAGGMEEWVCD